MFSKKFEGKCQEVSAIYGAHMGMRMKMEAAILSRCHLLRKTGLCDDEQS